MAVLWFHICGSTAMSHESHDLPSTYSSTPSKRTTAATVLWESLAANPGYLDLPDSNMQIPVRIDALLWPVSGNNSSRTSVKPETTNALSSSSAQGRSAAKSDALFRPLLTLRLWLPLPLWRQVLQDAERSSLTGLVIQCRP